MSIRRSLLKVLKLGLESRIEMVSKEFRRCVELVEEMVREGYRLQTPSTHVEKLIKVHIGADKRTIQKYIRMLLEDLGFLKVVTKSPFRVYIYRIDVETVEQYVSEFMKDRLRQLTLLDLRLREGEVAEKV